MNQNPFYAVDPSPVPLDPKWVMALDDAIRANDEQAIWSVMAASHDPADAHDKLATLVARMVHRNGRTSTFTELFLIPVIAQENALLNLDLWHQASGVIGDAVEVWKPKNTTKSIFNGIRLYDWVGTWSPEVIRKHLHSSIPGEVGTELRVLTQQIDVPKYVPKLGFILCTLSSKSGWPRLEQIPAATDERLKSVVSFGLEDDQSPAPVVLSPGRAQFSIPEGLCKWLEILHEKVGVRGWMVSPIAHTPDVIKVTLSLHDPQSPYTQFTLRKHQMGLRGVNCILMLLSALAPNLEVPIDLKGK